jgi:HTH-type transcriptional regulator/antitoxin HigA
MPDIQQSISPGAFVRRAMEAKDWSQSDLAYALGATAASINQILSDKRAISTNMAKALGAALGLDAKEIARVQADWDVSVADAPDPRIEARARILSKYPLREMIRRGWVDPENGRGSLEEQVCRFFGVSSMDEIPHLRHSAKKTSYEAIPPEQLAWLYRVKAIASEMNSPTYDKIKLREAIEEFGRLRAKPDGVRHVPRLLEKSGVRFVVVEGLPKAEIDGVCFWLHQAAPVIGMSLRFDRIDNFWFVLRHECAHVLHGHGQSDAILDCDLGETDPALSINDEERIANEEAADFCVPTARMTSFYLRKKPYFAEREVEAFAKIVGVHPGLVVGQLQRRMGRYDFLRKHLVKIRETLASSMMMDGWGDLVPTEQ